MGKFTRTVDPASNIVPMNEESRSIMALASQMVSRSALASRLGQSYNGDRDIYTALGYNKNPQFKDYYARYDRQDIAKRIIRAPVDSSWRKKPIISESKDSETAFEKAWSDLTKQINIFHYLSRIDRLSGIGQYGTLLIGVADGIEDFKQPIGIAKDLLYLRPYTEENAEIVSWEEDATNPRYGQPLMYQLKPANADRSKVKAIQAHWSRILHVAEECEEDDVFGTPRLKAVFNRLQDVELVAGGSAEMFWRGAFPGLGFDADPEMSWDPQTLTALRTEIEDYMHGLKRYLRLKGIDIKQLATQVADPTNHVSILLDLISGATGIPKRILIGSERGELASSQDENNWNARIEERRLDYVEPKILRPFIDRLIEVKILPDPSEEYTVEWPDVISGDKKETAEVARIKTEALSKYVSSPGADLLIPAEMFLKKFLEFTDEEVEEAQGMAESMFEQERQEISEERTAIEAERVAAEKLAAKTEEVRGATE